MGLVAVTLAAGCYSSARAQRSTVSLQLQPSAEETLDRVHVGKVNREFVGICEEYAFFGSVWKDKAPSLLILAPGMPHADAEEFARSFGVRVRVE